MDNNNEKGKTPFLHPSTFLENVFLSVVIPEVTIATTDPAVPGDNVTLNCSATGDTPLTYQWTMEGNDTTIITDTSTGILTLTNFTEDQFGTYICNVSNALGDKVSNITVVQASKLICTCMNILRAVYHITM